MKSRVVKSERSIMLSVCMIVKNEQKHIKNCLDALLPLFEAVNCELVIADTGSTDNTVEIAKQYTDKVYNFEYEGDFDFAAARNFSVSHAVGEWVYNLDADEYLTDPYLFNRFFKSSEHKKCNTVTSIIRNYSDENCTAYSDFVAIRMIRRKLCVFTGKIHEVIPVISPTYDLPVIFDHHGYAYESKESLDAKMKRNRDPLLEELAEQPENTRTMVLLSQTYFPREGLPILQRALEVERKCATDYQMTVYSFLVSHLYLLGRLNEVVDIAEEYFKVRPNARNSVSGLDMHAMLCKTFHRMYNFEAAYENYLSYVELYEKYHTNELPINDLRCLPSSCVTPNIMEEVKLASAVPSLVALERFDEALELLKATDIKSCRPFILRCYISALFNLVCDSKNEELFARCYEELLFVNNIDKKDIFQKDAFGTYYQRFPERRQQLILYLSKVNEPPEGDDFLKLINILSKSSEETFTKELTEYINGTKRWHDGIYEALYQAIKHDIDISPAVSQLSSEHMASALTYMADSHYKFSGYLMKYKWLGHLGESLCGLSFLSMAFEYSVMRREQTVPNKRLELINMMLDHIIVYVSTIYVTDLFNPDDIPILLPIHRFAYYMGMARLSEQNGDELGFIKFVHQALKSCEPMKDAVSTVLSDFEKRHNIHPTNKKK